LAAWFTAEDKTTSDKMTTDRQTNRQTECAYTPAWMWNTRSNVDTRDCLV